MKRNRNSSARTRLALLLMAGLLCGVLLIAFLCIGLESEESDWEGVRLSELQSSNTSFPDSKGIFADWIELQNKSEHSADLSGLILTDDPEQAKYVFPAGTVLEAGEFLLVYCRNGTGGEGYAPFGLSTEGGEAVSLMDDRGRIVDEVKTFPLGKGQSMSRGETGWEFCSLPSPGYPNTPQGNQAAADSWGITLPAESPLELEITELMSQNRFGIKDEDQVASDWFEITNVSSSAISLKGLRVSTLAGDPDAWQIREDRVLEAGESVLIFASGKNRGEGECLHTDFRLSAQGESLYLYDFDLRLVDLVQAPSLAADEAWQKREGSFEKTYAQTPGKPGAMSREEQDRYLHQLVINEVCASYSVGKGELFSSERDWIELKNCSGETLDLAGFRLSDNDCFEGTPLSGTLAPGAFLLLWADDGEETGHLNFSLSRTGETLTLFSPWGTVVDRVSYDVLEDNCSYARKEDGSYQSTFDPTPGFANTSEGLLSYYDSQPLPSGLVINEVMTDNFSYLPQSYGECYDWIEIRNWSGAPQNLEGYTLSDRRDKPALFSFPAVTLMPGECYVVLASGDEGLSNKSYRHTVFKLSFSGETLYLFAPDGSLTDAVAFGPLPVGASYGRKQGQSGLFYFSAPTPGQENGEGRRWVADAPVSLTPAGDQGSLRSLQVSLQGEGTVYYTLDGSVPTRSSPRYQGSIPLNKTTVVRAFCVSEGKLDSAVASYTYVLDGGHSLPVISVSTHPDHLWDFNTGIYVKGPGAAAESPYRGANFYKDWEKPANVTYYDPQGEGFSVDCGLKIFGNTGRALEKKSFQLKFKSCYGTSKLRYELFENSSVHLFDSLVLRSGSQDYQASLLRDAVISELCYRGMSETEAQDYRYCVLYLNGEYWGIYCIREKLDEDFVAAHYGVKSEGVNVLGYTGVIQHGSNRSYKDAVRYAATHDLSVAEHYQYVADRICLQSYVDWFIAQMYVGNSDLDNVRFFQSEDYDGKWRWILYDFDLTFYRSNNPYSYLISDTAYYSDVSALMRNLMKNDDFRDYFLTRVAYQLENSFSEESVLGVIEELKTALEPEIPRERSRWNLSVSSWEKAVNRLENFVKGSDGNGRSREIAADIAATMGLTQEEITHYFG